METKEIMNNEVIETVDNVIYDVVPMAKKNVWKTVGKGAGAVIGVAALVYAGKKVYDRIKAKKDENDSEVETEGNEE